MCKSDKTAAPVEPTVVSTSTPATETSTQAPVKERVIQYPRKLRDGKVSVKISEMRTAGVKTLRMETKGLESKEPLLLTVKGAIYNSMMLDITNDKNAEIILFTTTLDEYSYAHVVGFVSNNGKSFSEFYMKPFQEETKYNEGYRGQDEFDIVKGVLTREFPIYKEDDKLGDPTGGMRTVTYKTIKNESAWQIKAVSSVDQPE